MSAEDLERYETEIELQLYKEYRDVLPMFQYVVETERRFYLANEVKSRTSDACGAPVEAITRDKQMRLRRLAARWIDDAAFRPVEIRFDVASVMDGAVDVLEGAF